MDIELIARHRIAKKLNITYSKKIKKILNEYNLMPIKVDTHGIRHYKMKDFIELKRKQNTLYNYFRENFLTYQEALKKGVKHSELLKVESKEPPELIRVNEFKDSRKIYKKESIEILLKTTYRREKLLNVKQISELLGVRYAFVNTILYEWDVFAQDKNLSKYYDPKDVDYLLRIQDERYNYFVTNYYTSKEVKEFGVTNYYHYGKNLDSIAKIKKLKNLRTVYPKTSIDKLLENIKIKNKVLLLKKEKKKKPVKKIKSFRNLAIEELQIYFTTQELIELMNQHNISYYYISIDKIEVYDRKEINVLKSIQSEKYYYYKEYYFTSNEVVGIGSTSISWTQIS